MKKFLALAVVAALSVAAVGCGGTTTTSAGTKPATVETKVK